VKAFSEVVTSKKNGPQKLSLVSAFEKEETIVSQKFVWFVDLLSRDPRNRSTKTQAKALIEP
jgi:hypothetical protein